jgi:hypothetical protein
MRARDPLTTAAAAFVAANVLHTLDHVRQGTGNLTVAIQVGGTALTLLAVVALVLARRRHPWAAPIAAAVGFSGAAGILASHALPSWSALSDSYPEIGADALSWTVMLLEAGAALALGLVAVRQLRAHPSSRPTSAAAAR